MNWAIVKNTWQMCLASKLRMIVVVLLILFPLIKTTTMLCFEKTFSSNYLSEPGDSIILVLALGSGCIGAQLNDGTLSLVLSRPVTIYSYAVSKWIAVSAASVLTALMQLSAELIVAAFRTPYYFDWGFILTNGLERILLCIGFSAVLMFFSSLVSSSKDLAVYLVFLIATKVCQMLAEIRPDTLPQGIGRVAASWLIPPIAYVGELLNFVLTPDIDLSSLSNEGLFCWVPITAYLAVIAFFISTCVYNLNRRELPYGAD